MKRIVILLALLPGWAHAAPREHARLERVNELGRSESLLVECGESGCHAVRGIGRWRSPRIAVPAEPARRAIRAFLSDAGPDAARTPAASQLRWDVAGPNDRRRGAAPTELRNAGDERRVKAALTLERRLLGLL